MKNGDQWTVLAAHRDGGLQVQHRRNGRSIQLPASYVRDSVELGYATTIHGAQAITADTMHGLITGAESRQQLYTMCTRGRLSNQPGQWSAVQRELGAWDDIALQLKNAAPFGDLPVTVLSAGTGRGDGSHELHKQLAALSSRASTRACRRRPIFRY